MSLTKDDVKNARKELDLPPERVVVMTNLGHYHQIRGLWFKWHESMKRGAQVASKDQSSILFWNHI